MKNLSIKVNTGAVRVPILNEFDEKLGIVEFIPTDVDILKRYKDNAKKFEEITIPQNPSEDEIIKLSENIKSIFDELLNYEVSNGMFGKCSPLTIIDGEGRFFYEEMIEAVGQIVESVFEERTKAKITEAEKEASDYLDESLNE